MSLQCNLDLPGPPNSASRALGLQVCSPVSHAGIAVMHLDLLTDSTLYTAVALWERLRGWGDGSKIKMIVTKTWVQARTHLTEEEPTPTNCPLTSTWATQAHTNKFKCNLIFKNENHLIIEWDLYGDKHVQITEWKWPQGALSSTVFISHERLE